MASLAAAGRLSMRLAGRRWIRPSRGFHSATRLAVAQNFTMPALSPTMTEGNIATWRVKEGDKFTAGDVLLEIETDKATMDVEAQEDGVVFKIVQPDGSKGVAVGTRIAVLAEADDDVASLEMPPDEKPQQKPAAAESKQQQQPAPPEADKAEAQPAKPAKSSSSSALGKANQPQKYPLYPSVLHLIKENGLDPQAVVGDMTPTGPNGRLLKGDVLAYLGKVPADLPVELENRFEKLAHLDLSNIKIKEAPKAAADAKKPADEKKAEAPQPGANITTTVVSLPVSLAAVLDAQDKIQASLGVFMPVSTFVARATDVANDALPRAGPPPPPSAAELFEEIVAPVPQHASSASSLTRGHYRPQVSALPNTAIASQPKKASASADVIDILAGQRRATTPAAFSAQPRRQPAPAVSTGINFFTVSVPKAEEKRAKVFLERLKVVLENEPGRLVL